MATKLKIVTCYNTHQRFKKPELGFSPKHVYAIEKMCNQHITIDYNFYCLTNDLNLNCQTIPLTDNLFGWWAKMELYKIPGPVLYLDLDTIIIKNIDNILQSFINSSKQFNTLWFSNKEAYDSNDLTRIGTGLQFWNSDVSFIYNFYKNIPYCILHENHTLKKPFHGDQNILWYILDKVNFNMKEYNPVFAKGKREPIGSFYGLTLKEIKKYKQILVFHGKRRPWLQDLIPYFI